jgi:hypothetical protein
MSHTSRIQGRWDLDDVTVDAIVLGLPVAAEHERVAALARLVRSTAADLPDPSDELAQLLRGEGAVGTPSSRRARSRRGAALGKVAGLGLAAKIALGSSVAAASVVSAGAAGVLPPAADHAVRDAIEAVTPVTFHDGDRKTDHPDNFGERVSRDATGESDGKRGVDGSKIAEDAPGSDHHPDPGKSNGDGSGQPDSTGLTRANETPAATRPSGSAPDRPPCDRDGDQGSTSDPGCDPGTGNPDHPASPESPDPAQQANSHADG